MRKLLFFHVVLCFYSARAVGQVPLAFEEYHGQVSAGICENDRGSVRYVLRSKELLYLFFDWGYSVIQEKKGIRNETHFYFTEGVENRMKFQIGPSQDGQYVFTKNYIQSSCNTSVKAFQKLVYSSPGKHSSMIFSLEGNVLKRTIESFAGETNYFAILHISGADVNYQVSAGQGKLVYSSPSGVFCETADPGNPSNYPVEIHSQGGKEQAAAIRFGEIDPSLASSFSWLTYLGGSSSDELFSNCITPDGGTVVTGRTSSLDFPSTVNAYQDTLHANYDAVIARFGANGNCLWSTYYGGNDFDGAWSVIRIDTMYAVCGSTNSTILPMIGATQPNNAGSYDGFVALFNDSGNLVRSTFFGSTGGDQIFALALDTSGRIVAAGSSSSAALPFTSGSYQPSLAGAIDAFIAVFDQQLQPQWCTYYGGSGSEDIHSVTTSPDGEIIFAGGTWSNNFPVTANAFQPGMLSMPDCYLVKFGMDGTRHYSTFFGGSNNEDCNAVVSDSAGNIYAAGFTYSFDFPILGNSYQTSVSAQGDAFLLKFNPAGQPEWSTFIGGSGADNAFGLARQGKYLYLCGSSESSTFPVSSNAIQNTYAGSSDGYVLKLDTAGNMVCGTFVGGGGVDALYGIGVTSDTSAISCGATYSTDLAVTPGAYQLVNMTQGDGYVVKFPMSEQPLGNSMGSEAHPQIANTLFPNPAEDVINFSEEFSAASIFSLNGALIHAYTSPVSSIDVHSLAQGVYMVTVQTSSGAFRSFLIQKY